MKQLLFHIISLLLFVGAKAQTNTMTDRLQESLSPSESRYNDILFDMDVKWQRQLYDNPAFYELKHENSRFENGRYRSAISAGYASGKLKGDFLPYEGNAFDDFRISGSGEYSIKSAGTIFGSARYARGTHENIGWSATRNAELYRPYLSSDSTGGDFHYEDYEVKGGYSFQLDTWFFGVSGSFHGEQAHRKTDPRALNNTTWLNLGVGAARLFNEHLLMVQAGFARNKQHLSLRYWRPGQQDCFFVGYGFGLYDRRESPISFGYSRMYYIKEGTGSVVYQSPDRYPLKVQAGFGYRYDYMHTEESSIKDLYASRTHHLNPNIRIGWNPHPSFAFTLLWENRMNRRKGYENIFEQYLVDKNNNIYDFRLIDTRQNYHSSQQEDLFQLKGCYRITPSHSLELMGGVELFQRSEKYKGESYRVRNHTVSPHAGIGYKMNKEKAELDISCLYIRQVPQGNYYHVVMKNESLQYLDFQHTFAPYAYYDSRFSSFQVEATYVYHFPKFGIGANFKLMYKTGERSRDAAFTQKIGFPSTAPMVTAAPDKHDEHWGSGSLFFVF